jgi:hypothetical protein
MNKPGNDEIQELCLRVAAEQNDEKFMELVKELNDLLEANHRRLHQGQEAGNTDKTKNPCES